MTNYERLQKLTLEEMAIEIKEIANWDSMQKRKANKIKNFYSDWLNANFENGSAEFPYTVLPIPSHK